MQAQLLSSTAARNINSSEIPFLIADGPGLAHDAGNLLQGLALYSALLGLPGVLRPEHLHYAQELNLLYNRSAALINRLLHGDNQTASLDPGRKSLAEVMRAFSPLLRTLAASDAILIMAVGPHLPLLPFAAEVLERVLVNLTRNASVALRSHTPVDAGGAPCAGQIRISVSGNKTHLRLTVADNGPGMSPGTTASFLSPTLLPQGAVTGLGHRVLGDLLLSTAGKMSIKVRPGRGTSVQIKWPIAPVTAVSSPSMIPSTRRTQRAGSTLSC